ncbi:MAG: thioredoxin family protein [Chitinophagales bacterium]|nr:thioredoxin family protein [Chitinophagaceae bacterium]MCB9064598.1 thioredoxin family protein [Chitinophagales bacterium]
MALTPSNIFEQGTKAPDFSLPDTISGQTFGLKDVKGEKGTVVMFICNHCPYVLHVNEGLVQLANDYMEKRIGFVAISSNDVINYPQDGPDKMKEHAVIVGYPFPYLYDETQEVAKAYKAACTPDLYVFDADMKCVYHGQLDDSRPGNGLPVTGADMRAAIIAILSGHEYTGAQKPSIGCNIKWK